jgi:hypothetical protein
MRKVHDSDVKFIKMTTDMKRMLTIGQLEISVYELAQDSTICADTDSQIKGIQTIPE